MKFHLAVLVTSMFVMDLQASSLENLTSPDLCKKEFMEFAKAEKFSEHPFKSVLADRWNQTFFRSVSKKMGEGIELHFEPKKAPVILKIGLQQMEKITFSKDCTPVKTTASLPWHLEKAFGEKKSLPRFDDYALKQIVDSGKPAVIYSWSPKYAYSVYDLPRVKKIAEKLGYQFIAVADPRISESELQSSLNNSFKKIAPKDIISRKLASEKDLPVNVSYELYFRGGFNHFPFTYVVNNGKIHPRYIVGVMKDEGYREMMKTFMKELE